MRHVAICGGGLAAHMTAAALSRQLPGDIDISMVEIGDQTSTDIFYGNVTAATAYDFNRSVGLSEPTLVVSGDAAFSWGTKFDHWADGGRSWIQCFHLSLPVIDGVMFHHYLVQQDIGELEPYLFSAVAGRKGKFAHPPRSEHGQDAQTPLSRAEYGYQFDPHSYAQLFMSCTDGARVRKIRGTLREVARGEAGITELRFADGSTLNADLYVDCTGPDAALLSRMGAEFVGGRRVAAAASAMPTAQLGAPLRSVTPTGYGWRADTPLRGGLQRLTVCHPDNEADALAAHGADPAHRSEMALGRRMEAWVGNCVAIGHASCSVEPLTPSPLMLLERDIERLLSLIPVTSDMTVERREFNRRFADDYEHSELFTRALFQTDSFPDEPYWRAARAEPVGEKLARKIEMFEDCGLLVAYDLEPFHAEDWTILHFGMGRKPARHDRGADRAPPAHVRNYLSSMKRDIERVVETLPSHAAYLAELRQYLVRRG